MNKTMKGLSFALLIGITLGLLFGGGITAAQISSPPDSHGIMYLANHHKELKFSLATTESRTFSLPKSDFPVRIEASTSNVTVVFNGSTINVGPLVASTVASFDSIAGIGNMTGSSLCSDGTYCEVVWAYAVPHSDGFAGLYFSLRIDRNTGDITLSMRAARTGLVITAGQINCNVSMWF